ncbi:hypothetical protein BGZ54_006706 [Gamsiella multidivaricata]|nr:hypothetical protein BGZ54_006706 [Gamsiella multidivaricata]
MSQSTRSDHSLSQGQTPDQSAEAAFQQVTTERNSLRSQNDQLWKIIEKQRIIIQNLQKDIAKVTAERDLLRHLAAENENFKNNGIHLTTLAQVNDHQQQSKRALGKKAHENDSTSSAASEPTTDANEGKDTKLASVSSSSSASAADSRPSQQEQPSLHYQKSGQDVHTSKATQQTPAVPLSPSSNCDGDSNYDDGKDSQTEEGSPSISQEDEVGSQSSFDPEIQVATVGSRVQQQAPSTSPTVTLERDGRAIPARSNSVPSQTGQIPSPTVSGSPTTARNISGNLSLGPLASNMPLPPPRSPRRERRDVGDNASSPPASDNEDETYQASQGQRRKGPAAKYAAEQPSPLSQGAMQPGLQEQDSQVMSASKISMRSTNTYEPSADYDPAQPPKSPYYSTATRKTISAQIPTIPTAMISQAQGAQDSSSPVLSMGMNTSSTPASPIAAIIDQDAEKFRVYMSKLGNPNRRNVSAPISIGGDSQGHAAALGQAVAMETIQNQIEIQSQLLGQLQGHSGRVVMNPVHGGVNRSNVSAPINIHEPQAPTSDSIDFGRVSTDGYEHSSLADTMENNSSQLSLPSDLRSKKRESTLQTFDDYPKITIRTTSRERDDDDSTSGHGAPIPPKRYDSQQYTDPSQNSDISRGRVASPTPSANSSLTNTLTNVPSPTSHSRSVPTIHQQAFSMFADSLEFVSVLVVGSSISTNDKGREQLTFLISLGQEVQGEDEDKMFPHKEEDELWRVEKQYADFVNLDSKLRITQTRNIVNSLPKLPDKSLFSTHAPSKVDARKVALEQYLQQLTSLRIKDTRDLCEFLSTNVVEREKRHEGKGPGWKEGYLTKRGKNFGGWKTRYFMLRGPVLEYFDSKDGHHLGSIALINAQIGRQQSQDKSQDGSGDANKDGVVDPNSYRHAFLILEPKKGQTVMDAKKNPNSVIRHVLCAETDQERDGWIDALMLYVGKDPAETPEASEREKSSRKIPEIQKLGATPIKDLQSVKGNEKLLLNQEAYERQQRSIPTSQSNPQLLSQGRSGGMPQSPTMQVANLDEWHSAERQSNEGPYSPSGKGNNPPPQLPRNPSSQSLPQEDTNYRPSPDSQVASPLLATDTAEKKQKSRMTFWPKKAVKEEPPQVPSAVGQQGAQQSSGSPPLPQDSSRLGNFLRKGNSGGGTNNNSNSNMPSLAQAAGAGSPAPLAPARQVFGVSLEQAIEQAQVQQGHELPAVVYRCIEYLNAHKAKFEEGIYRLNGSAAMIKSLKERFNQEGDVPLLQEDEYYDIHAVAGLLKLFLRDLPSSVLTRELHKDFLQVIELANRADRVDELTRLVATLPEANYTLLRALTAHLIEIVDNADVNKMTARNVGIVFSPTLGIPAGVFALLMSDFDQIFHTDDGRIMPLENSDQQELIQQQQHDQQQQQQIAGAPAPVETGMDPSAMQA